jgi:hypothetical protein
MSYSQPNNKQEYWDIVYKYWDDIFHILNIYLPTFGKQWIDNSSLDKTLGEYILELKETKNPRLVRAFNAAWFNCPDEMSGDFAHKSWSVLCDLCSEEYVLYEEREVLDD